MRAPLLLAASLMTAAASAAPAAWTRRTIVGSSFTTVFPQSPDVKLWKPTVWHKKGGPGVDQYEGVSLVLQPQAPQKIDDVQAGTSDRYRDGKSLMEMNQEAWGEPTIPLRHVKVGDYDAAEAGWKFEYDGRMKLDRLFEVALGGDRYVYLNLNCFEDTCGRLPAIYVKMRDALKPPEKKKR